MNMRQLLAFAVEQKASDLHLSAGLSPMLRIDGDIRMMTAPALATQDITALLNEVMNETQRQSLTTQLACDFSFHLNGVARFRAHVFYHERGISGVFRSIPLTLLSLEDLQAPPIFADIAHTPRGLVLVTGPTGSGKSTSLAAIIHAINQQRQAHIITIEDPIEFVHQPNQSLIHQRELHRHTLSFSDALSSALREDPDVILVGEMRDLTTIKLALTAAETGHLVLATLHTASAAKTINRIIDVFPGNEQAHIRNMLSESLVAVISQTLLKKTGGGRIAAHEIMRVNPAIRHLIRENKIAQIYSVIQTSHQLGMQTLEQCLQKLIAQGLINDEEAALHLSLSHGVLT
jgi:twitching motility protein PilT